MNDCLAVLLELFAGDPHWLELVDLRQDGTAQPARVFPVCGCVNLRTHRGRGEGLDLFLHALLHAVEHCAATCEDNVLKQILLDVVLALHDRFECVLVNTVDL